MFLPYLLIALWIIIFIFLVQIPISIARARGVAGEAMLAITVLSWLGILFGITWVVALILSLVGDPQHHKISIGGAADQIEKLHRLYKNGAITKQEYEAEKKRILK
ncbi:MAG: SHOCT domain-containing protein [Alphaproteobacteria bacterium]|nr:SHOCT domain-containing protein [Alphaproteobacteria bacterium]